MLFRSDEYDIHQSDERIDQPEIAEFIGWNNVGVDRHKKEGHRPPQDGAEAVYGGMPSQVFEALEHIMIVRMEGWGDDGVEGTC